MALRCWKRERNGQPTEPLFPTVRGQVLSHDGLSYLLAKHIATACTTCSSLSRNRVTPHVLRHSLAMELLQHGVDCSVIALWLGHESVETTQIYLHADMKMKEQALARTKPFGARRSRYQPSDQLLAFLKDL